MNIKEPIPTEAELKAAVLNYLVRCGRIDAKSIISNELPLKRGGARADLAILTDKFIGIEIKSNRDSLRRLNGQLNVFKNVFDEVLLVVGDRHLKNVSAESSQNIELWVAQGNKLTLAKRANKQPKQSNRSRGKFCSFTVLDFKARYEVTSKKFWDDVEGRNIEKKDLKTLSRHEEVRRLTAVLAERQTTQWARWNAFLNAQSSHSSSVS